MFSLLETLTSPSGVVLGRSMTLSDKPGPSPSFTHKNDSPRVYTREQDEEENGKIFFFCKHSKQPAISSGVHTNLPLLLPVITLIAPLNSSAALSLTRKMTDKISYCSITGHCIPLSSPLPESPHLISNSGIKASANVQNVRLYVTVHFMCKHNKDLCFSNLPGLNEDQ